MNFSKIPAKSTKLKTPLNKPNMKPKMVFSVLYDEMLPSNKNNNRLVNNLNIILSLIHI